MENPTLPTNWLATVTLGTEVHCHAPVRAQEGY